MNKLGTLLEQFGVGLRDLSVVGMGVQFNYSGNISKLNFYFIVIGMVLSLAGKTIAGAFPPAVVQKALAVHDEQIKQLANDTAQIKKGP